MKLDQSSSRGKESEEAYATGEIQRARSDDNTKLKTRKSAPLGSRGKQTRGGAFGATGCVNEHSFAGNPICHMKQ